MVKIAILIRCKCKSLNMKIKTTKLIATALVAVMMLASLACKKKEVKKISINNQMAVSLFCDTISLRDIINDMDSTTNTWMRIRNDSLFAYYSDSVMGALKASDFLSDIEDTDFSTSTDFSLDAVEEEEEVDTMLFSEKFTEIPFEYDGFKINEVIMRSGTFTFDLVLTPEIPMLKKVAIWSDQLLTPDNDTLVIEIDYEHGRKSVDLSGCKIKPDEDDKVYFSSWVTIHYDPQIGFEGGDFTCDLTGQLTDVAFETIYATATKPIDSIFTQTVDIDFGVNGLTGSAFLHVPDVSVSYCNTFGLWAHGDITTLDLVNENTGLVTDLLVNDSVSLDIRPTNGQFVNEPIDWFTDEIDALAGYNKLDFQGHVIIARAGEEISISDTSEVHLVADIEMPLAFKISELHYLDTIEVNFSGNDDNNVNIDDYFDEIDFFIDYNNHIPLQVGLQGIFLKDGQVLDSLFEREQTILFNTASKLTCVVTGNKLRSVENADHMILRLGATTRFEDEPVMVILKESDNIELRMRILTKTTELSIDDL